MTISFKNCVEINETGYTSVQLYFPFFLLIFCSHPNRTEGLCENIQNRIRDMETRKHANKHYSRRCYTRLFLIQLATQIWVQKYIASFCRILEIIQAVV